MSGVFWPGDMDSYFAMCDQENERERRDRQLRERAETDPTMQCEHGVSLYKGCRDCREWENSLMADGRPEA